MPKFALVIRIVPGKTSQPLAGGQLLPPSKPAKMRVFYLGTDTLT
jgi:hypothetical protein